MEAAALLSEVVPLNGTDAAFDVLELRLRVSDPDILAELRNRRPGGERERYAEAALRVGVLALRSAGGQLDAAAIKNAGQEMLSSVRELLTTRSSELTAQLTGTLTQYFDPRSGLLPQRIENLVKENGELERLLKSHVGPGDSSLAKSLSQVVGEGSSIFKLLSPTDSQGLRAQLTQAIEQALNAQRDQLLGQFSLDSKESALSRLVDEIQRQQTCLSEDLRTQVGSVVKEFSLDEEGSALNRLVKQVESAQKQITNQFSADNADSALNRLSGLLKNTSDQIGQNLTLDEEGSALSRLKKELTRMLEEQGKKSADFQSEVRETLAVFKTRKEDADRTTLHGLDFEARLGTLLETEALRLNDVFDATGTKVGLIKNNKTGDFVTEMGPDSRTPGARVVWEAKEVKGYGVKSALEEIDEARRNRQAQVGVFVLSKKVVQTAETVPLQRFKDDLVVLWDPDDAGTDIYVKAAYHCARAMTVRTAETNASTAEALLAIDVATRDIEKQLNVLDDIRTTAETTRSCGEKISKKVDLMRSALERRVDELGEALKALQVA